MRTCYGLRRNVWRFGLRSGNRQRSKGDTMLSFLGDKKLKSKYLTRVRAHAKADEIVKGQYWENGKGCNIGCAVHTSDNPHATWAKEIGPEWLARLGGR